MDIRFDQTTTKTGTLRAGLVSACALMKDSLTAAVGTWSATGINRPVARIATLAELDFVYA